MLLNNKCIDPENGSSYSLRTRSFTKIKDVTENKRFTQMVIAGLF